jgi:hypothetical protein
MDYERELQVMFWKGAATGYLFGVFFVLSIHRIVL